MEITQNDIDVTEQELIIAFKEMDRAVNVVKRRGSFGRGYEMHDAAVKVAPEWLKKWDTDNRWIIPFTQGVDGFFIMAKAFEVSREKMLRILTEYRIRQS